MVDPKDLLLLQDLQDACVEIARGFEAVTERLLDHHTPPERIPALPVFTLECKLGLAELLDDRTEELVANREIKDGIAPRAVSLLDLRKNATKPVIKLGRRHVALDIGHLLCKAPPHRLV